MIRYIIKRILLMIPVVLGVIFIVYGLISIAPGDPTATALSPNATEEEREAWREEQGLNDPFLLQYVKYVYKLFIKGDFGKSYSTKISVADEIWARLPKTLSVALLSVVVAQLVGIPIGILSAVKQYSAADNIVMILALIGVSLPSFWTGLMLSIIFALKLGWLPASGLYGPQYYVLPVITLSLCGMAVAARMTRSSMLDVIRQDYITTARAKGVSGRSVIFKHALRNAWIPILTQIGTGVCALLGGAVVSEMVFAIPGIGTYMTQSISKYDYPCLLGSVVVVSVTASIILLLLDLSYALVDPRIRGQYQTHKPSQKKKAEVTA